MLNLYSSNRQNGFTLIEVLVSLGILAVMSVMSYQAVEVVLGANERSRTDLAEDVKLQRAWQIIGRDLLHMRPRRFADGLGQVEDAYLTNPSEFGVRFSRGGGPMVRSNPSGVRRVDYKINSDQQLQRTSWAITESPRLSDGNTFTLIGGVKDVVFEHLSRTGYSKDWPPINQPLSKYALPRMIRVTITLENERETSRLFPGWFVIKSGPQKQRGVALLAALILMLAVVLILTNIFYRHQIDVSQASASLHGDQALLIAISGEGWAGELLSDKNDNRDVDDYGEIWAQAMPLLPVEGGTLKGCVSDLQGKINLNSFVTYRGSSLNNELNNFGTMGVAKAWLNLMDMLQIPASPDRVATIVDWVDSDSSVINSWGAEQPDYEGLTFPRMVANDFISDASELAAIKGYSVQEVQMLSPWMTALPGSTPININTASEQLILALGGENGQQFLDLVKQMRPMSDINTFYQELEAYFLIPLLDVKKRWPPTLVSVKSDYFQLYLEVTLGEARIQVKSIMDRKGRAKPVIIAREITVVPASLPDKEELSAAEQLFAKKSDDEESNEQLIQQGNIVQPACVAMGLMGEIT